MTDDCDGCRVSGIRTTLGREAASIPGTARSTHPKGAKPPEIQDRRDYVHIGGSSRSPSVHVGAYAQLVEPRVSRAIWARAVSRLCRVSVPLTTHDTERCQRQYTASHLRFVRYQRQVTTAVGPSNALAVRMVTLAPSGKHPKSV